MKNLFNLALVIILCSSCYLEKDYDFENIAPDQVITHIGFSKDSLLANGSDTTLVFIVVNDKAANDLAKVSLKTNKGTFVGTDSKSIEGTPSLGYIDGQKKRFFTAILKADLASGPATLLAEVAETFRTSQIEFVKNYPESIVIIPSQLGINPGFNSEIDIAVKLSSSKGTVTNGHKITLNAIQEDGSDIGSFRVFDDTCDSSFCNFKYSVAPDTSYTGEIKLMVSTETIDETINKELSIYSIK